MDDLAGDAVPEGERARLVGLHEQADGHELLAVIEDHLLAIGPAPDQQIEVDLEPDDRGEVQDAGDVGWQLRDPPVDPVPRGARDRVDAQVGVT